MIESRPHTCSIRSLVASEVHRNGVQPVLLASPPGVETGPRAERPLERVRDEILGELAVTGPIDEKREQRLGVGLEQPLES